MYPLCIDSSVATSKMDQIHDWNRDLGTSSNEVPFSSRSVSKAFNVKDERNTTSNKNWSFVSFCIPCSDNLTPPRFFSQLSSFCSSFLRRFMHPLLFARSYLLTKPLPKFGTASDLRDCRKVVNVCNLSLKQNRWSSSLIM